MTVPISLIIPVYNRQDYLAAAIKSVLAQTRQDFELLVWDDASTDDSVAIARHYAQQDARIKVIEGPHQGVAGTLKSAVAATTGDYIGWVDSDDLLAPTALAATAAVLEAHPKVGLVYTDHEVIDEQGKSRGIGSRCHIPYSPTRLLVDFMTFHFRLIRRSVYDQVGGIDASYGAAEDYDLCLKLSEVAEVWHVEQILYAYRRHSNNVSRNQLEMIRWTEQSITQAISRRGLDDRYELTMQIVSQFTLRPKRSAASPAQEPTPTPMPAISPGEPPKVSVIIPTYNRRPYLERALTSVGQQTYGNCEIIVIDDGSTDGTSAWLQQAYPQVKLIRFEQNRGAAAARNAGVRLAQGEWLAFLDSDDQWLPEYLLYQTRALEQHPQAILTYCNYVACYADAAGGTPMNLTPLHANLRLSMLIQTFIHTLSQVVIPRWLFEQVGGFDEQLRGCHDWDFYLRSLAIGAPVHVSQYLVHKYWLPHSLVTESNGQTWLTNGLRVLEKFYNQPDHAAYAATRSLVEQEFRATVAQRQAQFAARFALPVLAEQSQFNVLEPFCKQS